MSPHKPIAFIFAGVNGAGKSTLYYDLLLHGKYFGIHIDVNEFVNSFGNWKNPKEQFKATKIALKLRQTCMANKNDFNQETTLCGKNIMSLFEKLKTCGYAISLYYIGINTPQIAKDRVKARVAKGGHGVDSVLIDKRFDKSLQNLPKIMRFCDEIYLFDNSKSCIELIFSKANKYTINKISNDNMWLHRTNLNHTILVGS